MDLFSKPRFVLKQKLNCENPENIDCKHYLEKPSTFAIQCMNIWKRPSKYFFPFANPNAKSDESFVIASLQYWSVSEIHLWHSQIIAALCSILLFCFSNILPDYVFCENKYIFLWLFMLQSFTRTETPFQRKLEKVVCLSKSNSKTNLL